MKTTPVLLAAAIALMPFAANAGSLTHSKADADRAAPTVIAPPLHGPEMPAVPKTAHVPLPQPYTSEARAPAVAHGPLASPHSPPPAAASEGSLPQAVLLYSFSGALKATEVAQQQIDALKKQVAELEKSTCHDKK